ncbi:hypothetical protein MCOR27_003646 [Pyricularia oryzae]|uniref:Hydrophobin n=2 Tax=Pyricularia TaxID=48558 RepID=A0ABQ8N2E4_PYRGI|nr:hypothetical protein MCOR01_010135 [Pyricularia oryzae]KAI6290101.1 hypothetical protein MCOR33_011521 [Pyricularia grisea]KAH9436527.1 hypothetical protein MCOR02_000201 [Pyricularia oryzae]KAI6258348.1 hypothetical protein MCOR19_005297 [Pyricularia oryzae]KAI6272280.1 hypothetical protein MCOR26_007430 [Pyricularia oryzae]
MQIKALIVALFAGIAMAMPTDPPKHGGGGGSTPPPTGGDGGSGGGKYDPCQGSGAYNNAQCCATDILGLANLDCAPPPSLPTSTSSFTSICAAKGQRARCCLLPVLGQALLCQAPIGH